MKMKLVYEMLVDTIFQQVTTSLVTTELYLVQYKKPVPMNRAVDIDPSRSSSGSSSQSASSATFPNTIYEALTNENGEMVFQ